MSSEEYGGPSDPAEYSGYSDGLMALTQCSAQHCERQPNVLSRARRHVCLSCVLAHRSARTDPSSQPANTSSAVNATHVPAHAACDSAAYLHAQHGMPTHERRHGPTGAPSQDARCADRAVGMRQMQPVARVEVPQADRVVLGARDERVVRRTAHKAFHKAWLGVERQRDTAVKFMFARAGAAVGSIQHYAVPTSCSSTSTALRVTTALARLRPSGAARPMGTALARPIGSPTALSNAAPLSRPWRVESPHHQPEGKARLA